MSIPTLPKYHRQKFILALLNLAGHELSKMDLQKLLFLSQQETSASYYDFVPYHYGCYSFQAATDIERLQSLGWLKAGEKAISLNHSVAWNTIKESDGRELRRFMRVHKNNRGRELVRHVYKHHPFYAINSRISGDISSKEMLEEIHQEKESIRVDQPTLYTIGYEGVSFEAYINTLIKNGVRLLCDVRKNPLSRKFGFSKSTMSSLLPRLGIEYLHIPELGIVSEKRKQLNSVEDYKDLFDEYKRTLPQKAKYLTSVVELVERYEQVALTCFEKHPQSCHRHCVSDYLQKDEGVKVVHL